MIISRSVKEAKERSLATICADIEDKHNSLNMHKKVKEAAVIIKHSKQEILEKNKGEKMEHRWKDFEKERHDYREDIKRDAQCSTKKELI